MTRARLALLVFLAAGAVGCSSEPTRPKPASFPALPAASLDLHKVWSAGAGKLGDDDASHLRPAVADGKLVLAGAKGRLRALDGNGKTLWERRTGLPLSGGLAAGYGRVLAGTREGDVAAFSLTDGSPLWTRRLSAAVLAPAALTADRVVVQSQDGRVHVLDAANGNPVWSQDTSLPEMSLRGYAPPVVAGDLVLAASATGKVTALDLATGAGRWEAPVALPKGRTDVERLSDIDGDMLVAGSDRLYVAGYQGNLTALDLRERSDTFWDTPVSALKGPAEGLGNVYIADADGVIRAFDAESGKAVWVNEGLKYRDLGAPVVVAGRLAVGDLDGHVHFFAQTDGTALGRIHVRGGVNFLLPWGDRLLVATARGVTLVTVPAP